MILPMLFALILALQDVDRLLEYHRSENIETPALALQDVDRLIEDLGSDLIEIREQAQAGLVKLGEKAVPALRKAAESQDVEVSTRAKSALKLIRQEMEIAEITKGLSPTLLAEAPKLMEELRSNETDRWLKTIEALTGVRRQGHLLEWGRRTCLESTRRDFIHVVRLFYVLFPHDWTVEQTLLGILEHLRIPVPEDIAKRVPDFKAAGGDIPAMKGLYDVIGGAGRTYPRIRDLERSADWKQTAGDALSSNRARSLPAARKLLSHEEPKVRMEAVELLAEKHPADCAEDFAGVMLRDESDSVRARTARVIGRFGLEKLEPVLREAVGREAGRVREDVVEALASLAMPESDRVFVSVLKDEREGIRYHAVTGLCRIRSRHQIDRVVPLIRDPSRTVRVEAVRAVGLLGESKHCEAVRPCLKDPDLRDAALETLGRLGDPEIAAYARRRLDDLSWWTRREAVRALARSGAPPRGEHWLSEGVVDATVSWQMNLRTSPEFSRKLGRIDWSSRRFQGTLRDLARRISKDTGVPVSCELEERVDLRLLPAEKTLLNLMSRINEESLRAYVLILEDSVRIVSREDAFRYWDSRMEK